MVLKLGPHYPETPHPSSHPNPHPLGVRNGFTTRAVWAVAAAVVADTAVAAAVGAAWNMGLRAELGRVRQSGWVGVGRARGLGQGAGVHRP